MVKNSVIIIIVLLFQSTLTCQAINIFEPYIAFGISTKITKTKELSAENNFILAEKSRPPFAFQIGADFFSIEKRTLTFRLGVEATKSGFASKKYEPVSSTTPDNPMNKDQFSIFRSGVTFSARFQPFMKQQTFLIFKSSVGVNFARRFSRITSGDIEGGKFLIRLSSDPSTVQRFYFSPSIEIQQKINKLFNIGVKAAVFSDLVSTIATPNSSGFLGIDENTQGYILQSQLTISRKF